SAARTICIGIFTVQPYRPADGIANAPSNWPWSISARTRCTLILQRLASWPTVNASDLVLGRGMGEHRNLIAVQSPPIDLYACPATEFSFFVSRRSLSSIGDAWRRPFKRRPWG